MKENSKHLICQKKIKIVERPGPKFGEILKKVKKEKVQPCYDPKCLVGQTENGGNCRTNEITYEIECKECKNKYLGETSRNAHARGIEHVEDSESNNEEKREKSVMLRHSEEKHDGKKVEFTMKVLKKYQHDPLARQCAEAVLIKNMDPSKIINNKKEYHQPGDVEVKYQKNEKRFNCDKCDFTAPKKDNLKTHIESMHVEKRYTCDKCDFTAPKKESLKTHNESMHEGNHYACNKCDYNTTNNDLMKKHRKMAHIQNKEKENVNAPNIIDFIKRMRSLNDKNKNKVSTEISTNDIESNIESNIDDITSTQNMINGARARRDSVKNQNQSSKVKIASRRINCENCDKKFNKESTFKTHMKNVHGKDINNESIESNNQTQVMLTFHERTRTLRSYKKQSSAPVPNN